MSDLFRVELPEKLMGLFDPHRYKVAYGGRGGAKSWSFASALLVIAAQERKRILCARELQKSIQDSVHKLLADRIEGLGLGGMFNVTQKSITGANGSEFIFEGLRYNATSIKSLEGIDIAWVEQAERLSKSSLDILIPTVRKEGSEIWATLNPDLEEDESYQRLVVNPPTDAWVVKQNWRDNPWFTSVLRAEMEDLKRRDHDAWLNVWEGECKHALEGAIYANELRDAANEDRITRVPYDRSQPVHTAWDLGHGDYTAIWFFQRIGFENHFIDYHQDNQHFLPHYLGVLQEKGYVYGTHYMPHDAESAHLAGRSIADQMRAAGHRLDVVPRTSNVANDINIVRTVFPNCWFDKEKTADGIHCLRHYRYGVDDDTGRRSRLPLHDWTADGADSFRTFAVGFRGNNSIVSRMQERIMRQEAGTAGQGWMHA